MDHTRTPDHYISSGVHSDGPQFVQSSVGAVYFNNSSAAVNRLYTGRQDIADKLAEAFTTSNAPASEAQKRFVITGLGGTGKSEICLKFASDHDSSYWGIFWVDCSSRSNATESFKRIAQICRLPEADISTVKDYLCSRQEQWLLILDNADDTQNDYSQYFPPRGTGDIIITTRNEHFITQYSTVGSEVLEQLDLAAARELLLRATGIPESRWQSKERAATNIVNELGRHILALVQAGAFIKESWDVENYLDLYKSQKDRLFKFSQTQDSSAYNTVHATFEVSLEHLQALAERGAQDAKDALSLLNILAFVHYEGEIKWIFSQAAAYAKEILQENAPEDSYSQLELSKIHASRLPLYFPTESEPEANLYWQQACNKLRMFSLIKYQEHDNFKAAISVHPLVHTWIGERQAVTVRSESWFTASIALALSCHGKRAYTSIFEMLQGHMHTCLANWTGLYAKYLPSRSLAAVLHQFAWIQYGLYDDQGIETLLDAIDKEVEKHSQNFNSAASKLRTPKSFRRCFGRSRTPNERKISEYELYDLNSLPYLRALWLTRRNENPEAIRILNGIVQRQEKWLEEEHPNLLATKVELAKAYRRNKQILKAIVLLEHVVKIREMKLDEAHPSLLLSQHELALAYLEDGQVQRAKELLEHVVAIREKQPDDEPPYSLVSQHALALAYLEDAQVQKAIELLEHVVKIREIKLDEGHPYRLESQETLATAYLKDRQVHRALELLEHVARTREKKLDGRYPDILRSYQQLAMAYQANGNIQEAESILDKIRSFPRRRIT